MSSIYRDVFPNTVGGCFSFDKFLELQANGTWPVASRGMFFGEDYTQYVTITSLGNATQAGDLYLSAVYEFGAAFSGNYYGILAGGGDATEVDYIQYCSMASLSNCDLWGNLHIANRSIGSTESNTFGILAGGTYALDFIGIVVIATKGDSVDFGDLSSIRTGVGAVTDRATRAVFAGGYYGSYLNVIDYFDFNSLGDATDFGDLTVSRGYLSAVHDSTRGVFITGGDPNGKNVMDYITIASTGNATTFGTLYNTPRRYSGACENEVRGIFAGGYDYNYIDYITIQTTATSQDFGDLVAIIYSASGCAS